MTTPPVEGSESLPISLVAHVAFCPRRLWLEAVGEKVASVAIEQGIADHEAVDRRKDERRDRRRSVEVRSALLGVHGRCDVVDVGVDGSVEVVEFKSAPLRRSTSVSAQQRLQLALQGLALREAGHRVAGYSVYFTTARRSVAVEVSGADEAAAVEAVGRARAIVGATAAPPPLHGDPRCDRCSHAGVCLPEERSGVAVARRVHAADPDGEVLHLTTPGSRAFLSRGRVEVVRGEEQIGSLPVDRVQGLVIHGNVDVSSALLRELLWRRVSVVWASGSGRVVGFARSADAPNGRPRVLQHVASHEGRLDLARELVGAKIANQATFLRRGSRVDVGAEVRALRGFARAAVSAETVGELLGLEGAASATYFSRWPSLFSDRADPSFRQE